MPYTRDLISPGDRGGWPNQSPLGSVPNTLVAGLNVVPRGPGKMVGFSGQSTLSLSAANTMMPVKDTSGGLDTGSVIYSRGDTYWFIGSGSVVVGATTIGTAQSSLQLRIGLAGATFTAGIAAPSAAPTLAVNGAGNMTGTYAIMIAWKRSTTGAVSSRSPRSAVVSAASNSLKLTTSYVVPAGVDRVRVYSTKRGFGATGNCFFLSEHTVTAGSTVNITALGPFGNGQWADGDLDTELAPIENDPPPAGTHVLALGSVMVVLGCYGGAGYAFSFAAHPEAFSPDRVAFLPGPIVGVAARGADGFAYVWGTNYLAALILTPDGFVIPRILWAHIGFANPDAACLVESELWGFTNEPVRTTQTGDPDTNFGLAWRDYMRANWLPANVVVGYSPEWNAVVYMHGTEAVAYYRGLDAWSTLLTGTTGNARAAVTVGGQLAIAGTAMQRFGGGSGTSGFGVTEFRDAGAPGFSKTIRDIFVSVNGTVQVDLLINMDNATSKATGNFAASGDHHERMRVNVANAHTYSLKFSGAGTWGAYGATVDSHIREAHI